MTAHPLPKFAVGANESRTPLPRDGKTPQCEPDATIPEPIATLGPRAWRDADRDSDGKRQPGGAATAGIGTEDRSNATFCFG